MAMTAECLSCSANQTEAEYCAEHPDTEGCPRACCMALTAECLSCSAGQTEAEYCAEYPDTAGCPQACCQAMTAECLSCQAGQTEAEYCAANPDTAGCVALLQTVREECHEGDHVPCPGSGNMCAGDQCCPRTAEHPYTFPCPSASSTMVGCENDTKVADCVQKHAVEPCCMGLTADCLSCSAGQTVA